MDLLDDVMEEVAFQAKIELPEVEYPKYPPMAEGEGANHFNCLILDTINELQDLEYIDNINKKGKADFQAYIDLNVSVKIVTNLLKKHFDEIVMIVGPEGSGKSFGIKTLNPRTTMWLNTDNKPPTFKGGKQNYSAKQRNMSKSISSYKELNEKIELAAKHRDKTVPFVVFLLGHLGVDKDTGKQKLKTIGKFSEKLNLDGAVTNCFFTRMQVEKDNHTFFIDTQNDGNNTGRCVEELFPTRYIPNNFEYIRQQIINY